MPTADELQEKYNAIEKERDGFVGSLESELEIAQQQGFTENHKKQLQEQIAQARASFDGILNRVQGELSTAREREAQEAAAKQQAQQHSAEEEKQQMYLDMRRAWIANHGDPALFDASFPQLYQQEMSRRTLQATQQDEDRRGNQAAIRNGM